MKKKLLLNLSSALLCLLLTTNLAHSVAFVPAQSGGGITISVEDDILRTSVGDPDDEIVLIEVFDVSTRLYHEVGCYDSICFSDLSGLAPGTYLAVASSYLGEEASQTIVLP
jgi:hypothetical protein